MIMLNYVPNDFGKGITIPLLKQDSKSSGRSRLLKIIEV